MRKQALDLIGTFARMLPMLPPTGDGFDIFTGQIIPASWSNGQQPLLIYRFAATATTLWPGNFVAHFCCA